MPVTCHPPVHIHNLHNSLPVRGAGATRGLCFPDMGGWGNKTEARSGGTSARAGEAQIGPWLKKHTFEGYVSCSQWNHSGFLANTGYGGCSLCVGLLECSSPAPVEWTSVTVSVSMPLFMIRGDYTRTLGAWPLATHCGPTRGTLSRPSTPGKMSRNKKV